MTFEPGVVNLIKQSTLTLQRKKLITKMKTWETKRVTCSIKCGDEVKAH